MMLCKPTLLLVFLIRFGSCVREVSLRKGNRSFQNLVDEDVLQQGSCRYHLESEYCCATKNGQCRYGKPGERSICDEDAGMRCYVRFSGRTCMCRSNKCYDPDQKRCVDKAMAEVLARTKANKTVNMRVEDFFDQLMGFTGGTVGTVVGTALAPVMKVLSPFQSMARKGAIRAAGSYASWQFNRNLEHTEGWLQWALGSFVLEHDEQPKKACNMASSLSLTSAKIDFGKCYLSLAYPDGVPLWEGPIYSYSDGKGNDFNISLMVKAGQIRCLEKLQVQKSRCFGNVIADGGLCQIELAPATDCPLNVTDLEVEIFCEGKCKLQDHVRSMLTWEEADNAIEVGSKVYIYKEGSRKYGKKCEGELNVITKNIVRCDTTGKKCLRHCVQGSGCWHASNLLTEKYCEAKWKTGVKRVFKLLSNWMGESSGSDTPRLTLIYRKFNAILKEVKVRTDLYIFRTRSLEDAIEEDANDERNDRTRRGIIDRFNHAFGAVSNVVDHIESAALGLIRSEKEATDAQMTLIKRYKFNMQPKRDETGKFAGYELVTCQQKTWNEATQAYDKPPLRKCQKIRLVNLQLMATEEQYLEIEEISSSQQQANSITGGSPGIVLSLIAKIARMMFARNTATMMASDEKGVRHPCKDMWTRGKTLDSATAVGVECSSKTKKDFDPDEVGDGVDARYEFEFVELQPIWDELKMKNMQVIGLRGGHNLDWCRVLSEEDPKTKLKAGSVVCDLELPTVEGTNILVGGKLPLEAQFRLQQTGENDVKSTVVVGGGGSKEATCEGTCDGTDEEEAREKVQEKLGDNANVQDDLEVRLISMQTGKYCRTSPQVFQTWKGLLTKKKLLLSCDMSEGDSAPETLLSLDGSTDGLVPSPYWDLLIILSLSCMGALAGWKGSMWATFLGGTGAVFTFATVVLSTAGGLVGGLFLSEHLAQDYHMDGIMMRYMMQEKLQTIGQQILYMIESALDFELPRI